MSDTEELAQVAKSVEAVLAKAGVQLTLGGEPTYVPINPEGAEWSITALGPTKLRYAYAMAQALIDRTLPKAVIIYTPGKQYPGEVNPRWALHLVWNRDATRLMPAARQTGKAPTARSLAKFRMQLARALHLKRGWLRAVDPLAEGTHPSVLPLDYHGRRFVSASWPIDEPVELLGAEGPAGLRLPLGLLPREISRRALTLEVKDERLHIFLPPLFQGPLLKLLAHIARALDFAGLNAPLFSGYLPPDAGSQWSILGLASDPGVLEINLPACPAWTDYRDWMTALEAAADDAGLRSFKQLSAEETAGTGGGNHVLFGGPTLDENAFFRSPAWITSILRYWQQHPALSYLFTGNYVGPSSQAPRPDESASDLYDLEMAYRFLEELPPGDHRGLLSETLRHLHTDGSGNTHRSEISFDKFWNVNADSGCRGLIEFRALESLPKAEWMSAVALLWRAIAAFLLVRPCKRPLIEHGDRLHDFYFLPTCLWTDFEQVLRDLRSAGFRLPNSTYREIVDWRFPRMLHHQENGARLEVRKAHEGWPLLCETPLEGGSTSRFVDTSIERLEFSANAEFASHCELFVQGRRLPLERLAGKQFGIGLRYRRSALYPSLHPGIPPHLPLELAIVQSGRTTAYRLTAERRQFEPCSPQEIAPRSRNACKRLRPTLLTYDLRIP